ncbi:carbon starvation CstA family protein [Kocuria rhizophila]|nr:carbon starvation CstA family protein [Kocuria rhizophila]
MRGRAPSGRWPVRSWAWSWLRRDRGHARDHGHHRGHPGPAWWSTRWASPRQCLGGDRPSPSPLSGVYLRYLGPARSSISVIGSVLLMAAIMGGGWVANTSWASSCCALDRVTLAWCVIGYGFVATVLPVWLLLSPRDYLSTFMKVGAVALLAVAIVVVRPRSPRRP